MSAWKAKRFWSAASVSEVATGFGIELDGRKVKTPAKVDLIVPTRAMAESIAAEWDAQEDQIDPSTMPFTRSANAAIDKVATQFGEVADMLTEYGGTDLLCYRATEPRELIERQAQNWDPILDWAEAKLGARLKTAAGVMFVPQESAAIEILRGQVHAMSNFQLAAFHDLVGMSGSLLLGFAAVHDLHPAETIWDLSRVDETWQIEKWGEDEDEKQLIDAKRRDFLHASKFYKIS